MKKILFILVFAFIINFSQSQEVAAYKFYNAEGKEVSFSDIAKTIQKTDIVLFGEYHNNPISHWLKFELIDYLSSNKDIIIGSEIFEADDQEHLTKYLSDYINREALDTLARLWSNFDTDYAAIVELAKSRKIDFIATNIPRRFASMVNRGGFEALDTLSKDKKQFIAPLPIDYDPELPGYKRMIKMGEMMGHSTSENFPKAQAIKDATMAYFIDKNYVEGKIFFHFHGAYHSDNYEGILWYLKRLDEARNYVTLSTVTQENVFELHEDNVNRADFILVVNNNMTTSY